MSRELPREATEEMRRAGAAFALGVSLHAGYTWIDYMRDLWEVMAKAAPNTSSLKVGDEMTVLYGGTVYHCTAQRIPVADSTRPKDAVFEVRSSERDRDNLVFWVDADGRPIAPGLAINEVVSILEIKRR